MIMLGKGCVTEIVDYINSAVSKLELHQLINQDSNSALEHIVDHSPAIYTKTFEIIDTHTKEFTNNIVHKQFMELIHQSGLFENSPLQSNHIKQTFNIIAQEIEILMAEMIFISVNNQLIKQPNTNTLNLD